MDATELPSRPYLARVLLFHLTWVGMIVVLDLLGHVLVPSDSFVLYWYVAFIPIVYVVLALLLAPFSLLVGLAVRWLSRRSNLPPRLVASLLSVAASAGLVAIGLVTGRVVMSSISNQAALVVLAMLVFALFLPLPVDRASARAS